MLFKNAFKMILKKSQTIAEFIIMLSVVLVIFVVFFNVFDETRDEISILNAELLAKQQAQKLASGIDSVYLAGSGSRMNVYLPDTLKGGINYNITIMPQKHILYVQYSHFQDTRVYQFPIITGNITGNTTDINGGINLTNTDGEIFVRN